MNENLQFLQAFLKNPLKVGAIAPSSPELAAEMLQGIEPDDDNIVLELGVGTGAITKYLAGRSFPSKRLISRHRARRRIWSKHSMTKFPDDEHHSAATPPMRIRSTRNSGLGKVRYVVCCLAVRLAAKRDQRERLDEIEKFMDEGCELRIFQYAHGYYLPPAIKLREFLKNRYGKPRRSPLVLKNVPPAFTLTWSTV